MTGIKNCHTQGVDSIVLSTSPMLRVFITRPDHDLWRNSLPSLFSVGFHPHHTAIELECIAGQIANVEPGFAQTSATGRLKPGKINSLTLLDGLLTHCDFRKYRFDSVIRGGKGGFIDLDVDFQVTHFKRILDPGQKLSLHAQALHTIYVDKGLSSAWLVREGKEDRNFTPVCWSNSDLTKWTPDGLYIPMTKSEVVLAVAKYNLNEYLLPSSTAS